MVYFTCGACGEQVKKPNVEKHYTQKCRRCNFLTCIDCLKDFHGDEYKAHNQCMSEDQRYSKEGRDGWDPTTSQNKGEKKQLAWIGKLRSLLESTEQIDSDVRAICDVILNHENIPRKKPKFINFVKNIMRQRAQPSNIEKTWDLFSQALIPSKEEEAVKDPVVNGEHKEAEEVQAKPSKKEKKKKKDKKENANGCKSGEQEVEEDEETKTSKKKKKDKKKRQPTSRDEPKEETEMEAEEEKEDEIKNDSGLADKENVNGRISKKDKKRKRKAEEEEEAAMEENGEPEEKRSKFDWDEVIKSLLQQKSDVKLNKLKKRCLAEFMAAHPGTHKSEAEIGAKFDKKIGKKTYKILKDRVRLSRPEEEEASEVKPEVSDVKMEADKISFNKWEATSFGNDAQTEKFRRLMGIKTTKPPEAIAKEKRDDKKIFRDLEEGFEKARQSHFSAKGRGLGFS